MTFKRTMSACLVMVATIAIGIITTPTANAYQTSVPASIIASKCTNSKGKWSGHVHSANGVWPGYIVSQPTGTFKVCAVKLRLTDSDSKGDYYMLDVTMTSKKSKSYKAEIANNGGVFFGDQPFSLTVTSSESAINNVFDATPTLAQGTLAGGLTASVGIGVGAVSASISTSSYIDAYTTVSRTARTKSRAKWSGGQIAKVPSLEAVYTQKVKQRKKGQSAPKFTVSLNTPVVIYTWKKVKVTVHGATYWAYVPSSERTGVRVTKWSI